MPSLDAPLPPLTAAEITAQAARNLWCAVIDNAIQDATDKHPEKHFNCPPQNTVIVREARAWFKGAGDDFRRVCELAGLDVMRVQHYAIDQIFKTPRARRRWRIEAGAGK